MIKLVFCIKRRGDLSPEEFRRHWLEAHAALVRRFSGTIRICRYVQSHAFAPEANEWLRALKGTREAYDGIAEIWWRSWDDFAAAASPEGIEANRILMEDERQFVDHSRSVVFLTEEHEILP